MLKIHLFGGIRVSNNTGLHMRRGSFIIENTLNGHFWMYDTGEPSYAQRYIDFFTKTRKIDRLEGIIISHYHYDHHGGAGDIIRAMNGNVGAVYSPKVYSNSGNDISAEESLKDAVDQYDVPYMQVRSGYEIDDGDLKFDILTPFEEDVEKHEGRTTENRTDQHYDVNVCAKLTYGDFSFMFVGDAYVDLQIKGYKNHSNPKSTFIQIGHHGDQNYINHEILEYTQPEHAVLESYPLGSDMQSILILARNGVPTWSHRYEGEMLIKAYLNGEFEVGRRLMFVDEFNWMEESN